RVPLGPGVGLAAGHGRVRGDDCPPRGGLDPVRVRRSGRQRAPALSPHFSGSLASVDGRVMLASAATIPATDHGLLRGDGAFEVVRVYDGRTFALEEHLKRLERSASNLRLPVDLDAIRSDARRLLSHAGAGPDHELLRIVVTRFGRRLLL